MPAVMVTLAGPTQSILAWNAYGDFAQNVQIRIGIVKFLS